ncbi:ARM repeat-containing protein [Suhomyces tanzawaensis NRRL Y-17324]|uniref:ARM repeat-containing protein n=1 Tax=Suhomyces tanzawaensis NRRL Y-17324 TaxID=984487 RepID=A0A1E4SGI7_9ASCO|nr:ARM repeat-containing protein [Suhomyces tanzawaensis NRRL Y-17324]ODV78624.1 ARM repeat-containing protein [Suhomyces tanzawaensis NRRL Y-17324]
MSDDTYSQLQHALKTMFSNANQDEKLKASHFLESFQKSQQAWEVVHTILAADQATDIQFLLFAAQTLRSKITYDLSQFPASNLVQLKDSVITLLIKYSLAPHRLIRSQLCIALSHLSVQYLEWDNAFSEIVNKLSSSVVCLLDFLRVLPEELDDLKKFSLSDAEFNVRCQALITENVEQVLLMLQGLCEQGDHASLILDCLNNWIKEGSIEQILQIAPLTNVIFQSLTNDNTFDSGIECLVTIIKETRDIDNYQIIDALFSQLLQLHEFMVKNPSKREDPETFESLTRLFVEASEAWNVLIVKNPKHFKPLVEILLESCKYDQDLDIVRYTFNFWDMLKQLITLPKFQESKQELSSCFESLISIIIKQLTYPIGVDDHDLFEGDKEQEDKFKEFRYEMGDVLKNCCSVLGATKALSIPFQQIQQIISNPENSSSNWQNLESALFSMRTMAKEVPTKERTILPSIMSYLVQLPEHPKIRYSATLVLGRYTEWTSKNPQFLQPQLNYIIKGFEIVGQSSDQKSSKDIIMATSRALMYFCQDCSSLLVEYLEQLYMLYGQIKDQLDVVSHYELVDGLAHVINQLPMENLYKTTEMFINPTLEILNEYLEGKRNNDEHLADNVEVITTFFKVLRCNDFEKPAYPVATLFIDRVWPVVSQLLVKSGASILVSERLLKLIKAAVQSFSTYLLSILGDLATLLHQGFKQYNYGCYLWVSGILIREYGDEYTSDDIKESVYQFGLSQCASFFETVFTKYAHNQAEIKTIPDVVADYYRMVGDLLMFYPLRFTADVDLMGSTLKVSILTLSIVNEIEPLVTCLHFLIDLLSWGLPHPPVSFFDENPEIPRRAIQQFVVSDNHGAQLLREVVNGVIFKFHHDIQQDANDVILKILLVTPDQTVSLQWLSEVAKTLPNVNEHEIVKLVNIVSVALPNKDNRRVRSALKDFISWYCRKNVTPRSEF